MLRSFRPQPFVVAVGVVLGIGLLVSMAQTSATRDTWPPQKRDILNVFERGTNNVVIPPDGSYVVYAVPTDHWLTLTGAEGYVESPDSQWGEDFGGILTEKGYVGPHGNGMYSPEGSGGAIGWTFRPGSSVVVHNPSSTNSWHLYSWSLVGYLSRE